MERKERLPEHDEDDEHSPQMGPSPPCCLLCADPAHEVRYTHFLLLVRQHSLDGLTVHLEQSLPGTHRARTRHGVLRWAKEEVARYSKLASDADGHPMPWWEARAQVLGRLRAAKDAQEQHRATTPPP